MKSKMLFSYLFILCVMQLNLLAMKKDQVDFKEKDKLSEEQLTLQAVEQKKEEEKIIAARKEKDEKVEKDEKARLFAASVDDITSGIEKNYISNTVSSNSLSSSSGLSSSTPLKKEKDVLAFQSDSDSEDAKGYKFTGYESFNFAGDHELKCMIFFRGMHFSSSKITKKQRSYLRRQTKSGNAIYSLAAYELANITPGDEIKDESIIKERAMGVKKQISELKKRDVFQELYTNQFSKFNEQLKKHYSSCEFAQIFKDFSFKKNPQISTSEIPKHCLKYAFGKKHFESDTKILDPEYSVYGKPKHPYLGKIYVILVALSDIPELNSYFVVHGHANKKINVYNHYNNDILSEREVSFPGFIPGKYVIFEKAVRVPSFAGSYKPYYKKKHGIIKSIFEKRQQELKSNDKTATTKVVERIINKAIEHTGELLEAHIKKECNKHNITIYYKDLGDDYTAQLASTSESKNKHKK
jgi:hypothetical protein